MDEIDTVLKMTKDKSVQRQQNERLLLPYAYIAQIPDKPFRSQLSHAFNYWLDIPEHNFNEIEEILHMLHTSSLLIDDIEDNSTVRKGHPAAHCIYGVANTINAANYVFFLALEKIQRLGPPDAVQIYVDQVLELHRGQGIDIYWRDSFTCPTEMDYKIMTVCKLGGVFMMGVRLMQLFSKNKEDFSRLIAIISLYYQIWDDYSNTSSKTNSGDKSFAEDLTEGKFGFPIIHAIEKLKHDHQVLHILRQRTNDVHVKRYCIALLEKLGSFKYTRKVLQSLDIEVRAEIKRLGGNPDMENLITNFTSWK